VAIAFIGADYSRVVGALHPFFSGERPLVFAHRGGAALAPENTMAAFDNAVELGVDGIELDVRLSRDGAVIVHHDSTLDRMTALSGPVSQRTVDELRAAGVATLADVLARYRVRVIVELKENTLALARAAIGVITAANAVDRVCVGSFGLRVLRAVRVGAPAIATSAARLEVRWALYRSWCRWPVAAGASYRGYQIPERSGAIRVVSRRFVEEAHRAGLSVQVWTVNRESDARRLLAWGVDALITDRPDIMVPLIKR
jgi:glycerophosphoryl diester phosphodiesterase